MLISKSNNILFKRKAEVDIHESITLLISFVDSIKTTIGEFRAKIEEIYNKYLNNYSENQATKPVSRRFPSFRKITKLYDATKKGLYNFSKVFLHDYAKVMTIASEVSLLKAEYDILTKKFFDHKNDLEANQLYQLNNKIDRVIVSHNKLVAGFNAVIAQFIALKENLKHGILIFISSTEQMFAFSFDDELEEFQRLIDKDLSENRASANATFARKFKKDFQHFGNSGMLMPVTPLQEWTNGSKSEDRYIVVSSVPDQVLQAHSFTPKASELVQQKLDSRQDQDTQPRKRKLKSDVITDSVKFPRNNEEQESFDSTKSFDKLADQSTPIISIPNFIFNILPEDLLFDEVFGDENKSIDEINQLLELAAQKWVEIDVGAALSWKDKHFKKFLCTQSYSRVTTNISTIKSMYDGIQARLREIEFEFVNDKDNVIDLLDCILILDVSTQEMKALKVEYLRGNLRIYEMLNSYLYYFKRKLIDEPIDVVRLMDSGINKLKATKKEVDLYSVLNYFGNRLLHRMETVIGKIEAYNESVNDVEEIFIKLYQNDIYNALRNIISVKDKILREMLKLLEEDSDNGRPFEKLLLMIEDDVSQYNLEGFTKAYNDKLEHFNDKYLAKKFCDI